MITINELISHSPTIPLVVQKNASLVQIVSLICKHCDPRDVYVVNDSNKLLGIIPFRNILRLVSNEYLPNLSRREVFEIVIPCSAEDLMMTTFDSLLMDDNVAELAPKLLTDFINEIPVVDLKGKLVGTIKLSILLTFIHLKSKSGTDT